MNLQLTDIELIKELLLTLLPPHDKKSEEEFTSDEAENEIENIMKKINLINKLDCILDEAKSAMSKTMDGVGAALSEMGYVRAKSDDE